MDIIFYVLITIILIIIISKISSNEPFTMFPIYQYTDNDNVNFRDVLINKTIDNQFVPKYDEYVTNPMLTGITTNDTMHLYKPDDVFITNS